MHYTNSLLFKLLNYFSSLLLWKANDLFYNLLTMSFLYGVLRGSLFWVFSPPPLFFPWPAGGYTFASKGMQLVSHRIPLRRRGQCLDDVSCHKVEGSRVLAFYAIACFHVGLAHITFLKSLASYSRPQSTLWCLTQYAGVLANTERA